MVLLIQGAATLLCRPSLAGARWCRVTDRGRPPLRQCGKVEETRVTGPRGLNRWAPCTTSCKSINEAPARERSPDRACPTDDGYVASTIDAPTGWLTGGGVMICGVVQWPVARFPVRREHRQDQSGAGDGTKIATYSVDDNGREVVVRVASVIEPVRATAPEEPAAWSLAR